MAFISKGSKTREEMGTIELTAFIPNDGSWLQVDRVGKGTGYSTHGGYLYVEMSTVMFSRLIQIYFKFCT